MIRKRSNPYIMITIGSILSYLLFGLFDSMKGSTLSALLQDLQFNYSMGGTIVMGQYAGYFAATFLAGILADYCGQKITLIAAGSCMIFGLTGYSMSSGMASLLFFIFFIGMGLGALELVGCNIITELYPEKKGSYLNILTAIAGIGAILSPAAVGYLLGNDVSWRMIYRLGLCILIPVTLYFVTIRYSFHRPAREANAPEEKPSLLSILSHREILLMYLVNFSYMATEVGIATWMVDFYKTEKHFSVTDSAAFLSLFYICMTVGRVLGSLFVDRVGHIRSVLIASAGAGVSVLIGVFGPAPLAFCVAFTGLFHSIIFPTATAIISGLPDGSSARMQGLYFACGGLGGMFGPWILGIVNDLLGLRFGMAGNVVFCAGILIPILILKKNTDSGREAFL